MWDEKQSYHLVNGQMHGSDHDTKSAVLVSMPDGYNGMGVKVLS